MTREGYEAGLFIQGVSEEQVCSGSATDCEQYYLEPGKLYTVKATVSGALKGPEALYDALKSLLSEYPGVYMSYIKVEPQGDNKYQVIIQIFDPPVYGLVVWWQIVVILAFILAIIYEARPAIEHASIAFEKFAEAAEEAAHAASEYVEKHPFPASLLIIGLGALLLSSAIRKTEKS